MTEDIKIGVAVIIKNKNKILLGKRLNVAGSGQWGLPGGHVEYQESLAAAAKRETMEETGIKIKSLKLINITNDARADKHYIHFVFYTDKFTGIPKNLEIDKCESLEWFNLNKLPKPIFFGHTKLLEAVKKKKLFQD